MQYTHTIRYSFKAIVLSRAYAIRPYNGLFFLYFLFQLRHSDFQIKR